MHWLIPVFLFLCCQARQKDATAGEQRVGQQISNTLRDIIAPYFLRRTKAEVSQKERAKDRRQPEAGDNQAEEKIRRIAPE